MEDFCAIAWLEGWIFSLLWFCSKSTVWKLYTHTRNNRHTIGRHNNDTAIERDQESNWRKRRRSSTVAILQWRHIHSLNRWAFIACLWSPLFRCIHYNHICLYLRFITPTATLFREIIERTVAQPFHTHTHTTLTHSVIHSLRAIDAVLLSSRTTAAISNPDEKLPQTLLLLFN